jgi:DNA-directed RNA polymerase specialized sigma24 family protein
VTGEAEFQAWLSGLADGRDSAAQALWEGYFEKLVRFARKKLEGMPRRVVDEEDVALSALKSFVRGVERGRFPQLNDPDDLWRVLITITARKAMAQQKRHFSKKRGGGRTRGESVLAGAAEPDRGNGIGQVLGQAPTAEFQAMMTEQCEHLMESLDDARLRVVAFCKLEGHTNDELANAFNTTTRTVERWLQRIRAAWEKTS